MEVNNIAAAVRSTDVHTLSVLGMTAKTRYHLASTANLELLQNQEHKHFNPKKTASEGKTVMHYSDHVCP